MRCVKKESCWQKFQKFIVTPFEPAGRHGAQDLVGLSCDNKTTLAQQIESLITGARRHDDILALRSFTDRITIDA